MNRPKKQFRVALYDEKGEMYTWDVALGVPAGVGWNLSLRQGRDRLMAEIIALIAEAAEATA